MDNRIARLHLLAQVIAADGRITDEEQALIEKHMSDHELSDEEKHAVLTGQGRDEALALLRERPVVERQEIVDQLVEAAYADGRVTTDEADLVERLRKALEVT
jgi:uncharacterized tellurite resistance protein B-like protein